ncbi:MAG: UxaA family hydrolase, partial [Candidatus Adiutrix sp.]|nr:UxaA family hydrolase [Candidatus Adiutrix sp.]
MILSNTANEKIHRLWGYERPDGRFGIRNHLLIIPASVCASAVAARVAAQVPGAVALPNQHGCSQIGVDYDLTRRTLAGLGRNPNVGAVLVIGLGCEGIEPAALAQDIAASGQTVECLVIQQLGGTLKTTAAGAEAAARLQQKLSQQRRREMPFSALTLGLECGGSDPTSGLAANPAIGYASTALVEAGGSSILSETTEVIGAEHLLVKRFPDPAEARKFMEMVRRVEQRAVALGVDLRQGQPTPGNKAGGLSTIEEKSLGCMYKAGTSDFV